MKTIGRLVVALAVYGTIVLCVAGEIKRCAREREASERAWNRLQVEARKRGGLDQLLFDLDRTDGTVDGDDVSAP